MDNAQSTGAQGGGAIGNSPALFNRSGREARTGESPIAPKGGGGLLACLDDTLLSDTVLQHALSVARKLELAVTGARVIEAPMHGGFPVDPLEWRMRQREGRTRLDCLIAMHAGETTDPVESVLLTGPAADELTAWAEDHRFALMALGTHGYRDQNVGLGTTAQRVLERAPSSLLLVPSRSGSNAHSYRRILVALDGSSRAESVLPIALRIARADGAELILAHVVPKTESVGSGGQTSELCMQLAEQNERSARDYLNTLCAQLRREQLPVRAIVDPHGDPRTELRRIAIEQHADLIIVSSHGRSGISEIPCGSVTEYLATHAPAPLLIVRPNFAHTFAPRQAGATDQAGISKPVHA